MDKEIKREARRQYFHYFRIWFIVIAVLAVVYAGVLALRYMADSRPRGNNMAPAERVYDYADVLTDEEEQKLREYIAAQEKACHFDIVLVTINQEIESWGDWDTLMRDYADDFYDNNNFGFNTVHGDGVLLLDNWYEDEKGSQKGSWLSTCGSVYAEFGNSEINQVLRAVYNEVDDDPYGAYRKYVSTTCRLMGNGGADAGLPFFVLFIAPVIVAAVYAFIHLNQSPAKDTTTATAYVAGGQPVMKDRRDDFIRKSVVTRHIDTSSGSSGGGRSGGGGGHTSSGGVSHGGGGMRR